MSTRTKYTVWVRCRYNDAGYEIPREDRIWEISPRDTSEQLLGVKDCRWRFSPVGDHHGAITKPVLFAQPSLANCAKSLATPPFQLSTKQPNHEEKRDSFSSPSIGQAWWTSQEQSQGDSCSRKR